MIFHLHSQIPCFQVFVSVSYTISERRHIMGAQWVVLNGI